MDSKTFDEKSAEALATYDQIIASDVRDIASGKLDYLLQRLEDLCVELYPYVEQIKAFMEAE